MRDPEDTDMCTRWGEGRDRCVRHFDHDGDCMDRNGLTSTLIMRELMGKPPEPEFD